MSQPATSPKKRALMTSTPQRSRLRGHGHALDAIVRVGKAGLTPAITAHQTKALFEPELVKIKLEAECPDDRFTVADQLGEQPGVNVVQILGRTILLYKRHPQEPHNKGKRAEETDARANRPGNAPGNTRGNTGGNTGGKTTGNTGEKTARKTTTGKRDARRARTGARTRRS